MTSGDDPTQPDGTPTILPAPDLDILTSELKHGTRGGEAL